MPARAPARIALLAALLASLAPATRAHAQTSGANTTHDPSRIVESDGKFYFCSTGGSCASSTDGLVWRSTGLRIPIPAWATTYAPGGNQGIWAPDLVFAGGRYQIFYSFCGVPAADAPCAIGLYTTPTLDSTSPSFKLTDAGMVVNNPTNDSTYQFSTIDRAPIVDPSGDLWLAWGSGYGKDQSKTQLWLTRLDAITPLARYQGPRLSVITAANETPAALHAQLPGFPVRRVSTGHWVQLDDPEGVNRLLDQFLAPLRPSAGS